jgi:hypothetical protein
LRFSLAIVQLQKHRQGRQRSGVSVQGCQHHHFRLPGIAFRFQRFRIGEVGIGHIGVAFQRGAGQALGLVNIAASNVEPRQLSCGIGHLRIEFESAGEGGLRHVRESQGFLCDTQIIVGARRRGVRMLGFLEDVLGLLILALRNQDSTLC